MNKIYTLIFSLYQRFVNLFFISCNNTPYLPRLYRKEIFNNI